MIAPMAAFQSFIFLSRDEGLVADSAGYRSPFSDQINEQRKPAGNSPKRVAYEKSPRDELVLLFFLEDNHFPMLIPLSNVFIPCLSKLVSIGRFKPGGAGLLEVRNRGDTAVYQRTNALKSHTGTAGR